MRLALRNLVHDPGWRHATTVAVLAAFCVSACNLPVPASSLAVSGPCGNATCCCPAPQRDAGRCCCAAIDDAKPQAAKGCPRCRASAATHPDAGKWSVVTSRCRGNAVPWAFAGVVLYPPHVSGLPILAEPSAHLSPSASRDAVCQGTPPDPPPRG